MPGEQRGAFGEALRPRRAALLGLSAHRCVSLAAWPGRGSY